MAVSAEKIIQFKDLGKYTDSVKKYVEEHGGSGGVKTLEDLGVTSSASTINSIATSQNANALNNWKYKPGIAGLYTTSSSFSFSGTDTYITLDTYMGVTVNKIIGWAIKIEDSYYRTITDAVASANFYQGGSYNNLYACIHIISKTNRSGCRGMLYFWYDGS